MKGIVMNEYSPDDKKRTFINFIVYLLLLTATVIIMHKIGIAERDLLLTHAFPPLVMAFIWFSYRWKLRRYMQETTAASALIAMCAALFVSGHHTMGAIGLAFAGVVSLASALWILKHDLPERCGSARFTIATIASFMTIIVMW